MKKKGQRNKKRVSSIAVNDRKSLRSKSSVKKSSLRKKSSVGRSGKSTRKGTAPVKARPVTQRGRKTGGRTPAAGISTIRQQRKGHAQKSKQSSNFRSRSKRRSSARANAKKKIIRVLEHGQYLVDLQTLRKLNAIDNSIVRRLERGNLTDEEFKMKIEQLEEIVTKKGKPLDPKTIASSDIILPDSSLTIEEASQIFHGEGIIPILD